jgi:site-specific DNA recombinase
MKRAALYARVSTEKQKDEGTIESQLFELRQTIERDGNTLAHEYIDEGYSGGILDRPALNQLRKDVKADLFDAIYFHNADRIARDVAYQSIIIGELIKYGKQIIINGKDYVENPENKFALTVLGAVAELEKAKFAERSSRGRRHKVRQGIPATGGNAPYGYTLVHKSETEPQRIVVHEERAAVVKSMFEKYAHTEIGVNELTRLMQESSTTPAHGGTWSRSTVHFILTNTAYYGEINYYTVRRVPATGSVPRHVKFKTVQRDPSEHMTISIPAIVTRELWDAVQAKLARNRRAYRNSPRKYLLSGLMQCARDGRAYTGSCRRWEGYGDNRYRFYQCNHNLKMYGADYSLDDDRCCNKSVSAARIEVGLWHAIIREILDPAALKTHVEVLRSRTRDRDEEHRKKIVAIEKALRDNASQKQRLLDLYVEGKCSKEMFSRKMVLLGEGEQKQRAKLVELAALVTLIPDPSRVCKSIAKYCEELSQRIARITDYAGKRAFLLDVIEDIVFDEDVLRIRGFIPLVNANMAQRGGGKTPDAKYCPTPQCLQLFQRQPDYAQRSPRFVRCGCIVGMGDAKRHGRPDIQFKWHGVSHATATKFGERSLLCGFCGTGQRRGIGS